MSDESSLKQLPPEYWLRVFGDFMTGFGRSMLVPFMLIYLQQAGGFPLWEVTLLTAVPQFLQIFSTSWGGVLADHYGRKPVMFFALFGSGMVLCLMLSHAYMVVYAGYVLFLVVSNFYRPAAFAMVTDVVPAELQRDAFAILRTTANLGFAIGPLIGSLLFFSQRALAIGGTAVTYVLTACTVFWMRETLALVGATQGPAIPRLTSVFTRLPNPLAAFSLMREDIRLRWAVLTGIFFMMVQIQPFTALTVVVNNEYNDNGRMLAYLFLVNTIGVVIGQYFITAWTREVKFYNLFTAAILFCGAGWGTLLLPWGTLRYFLLFALTTIAEMLMAACYTPYIATLAKHGQGARYMSFSQTSNILGQMIGPTLGALGYGLGGETGFAVIVWLLLGFTYTCLRTLRHKELAVRPA
ncbi:MAG: MFS transporter [Peptococcaceae bacterium]|nr:MFS transporter [Peptococcaceae bacterium]